MTRPAAAPVAPDILTPSGIQQALSALGIRPNKRLGQSFLADRGTRERILAAADLAPADRVLEIGPGLGALTGGLVERCAEVVAVEKDRFLAEALRERFAAAGNLRVIAADILRVNLVELLVAPKWKVVSNLPFSITSPVLLFLIEARALWSTATVTVQREVADRLTAKPGGSAYGSLTIAVQFWCTIKRHGTVHASVFIPTPTVDATLLTLTPRPGPAVETADRDRYFRVVRGVFVQRRKTLQNALANSTLGLDRDRAAALLAAAGIEVSRRAQTLSLADFARLADALPQFVESDDR